MEIFNTKTVKRNTRSVGPQLRINYNTGELSFSADAVKLLGLSTKTAVEFARENGEWFVRKANEEVGFFMIIKQNNSLALRFTSKALIKAIREDLSNNGPVKYSGAMMISNERKSENWYPIIVSSYK